MKIYPRTIVRSSLWCFLLSVSLGACAREPETVGLTAVSFNYSEEGFLVIKVNGKWAGSTGWPVEPGDVTGGGSLCCIELVRGAKTATVEVDIGDGKPYVIEAPIEQPWTSLPHSAVIHVLPGRKAVISIAAGTGSPRSDLLKKRLQEMDIHGVEILDPEVWQTGPDRDVN